MGCDHSWHPLLLSKKCKEVVLRGTFHFFGAHSHLQKEGVIPGPQFFLLAPFENAIWRVVFVNTFEKKCLKGLIIFSLIEEEMKNSFFKNPPSPWGGGEGGRWKIECSKTSLSPLVFMWCGKCKYHILLPTKDIQRWTLYRYFWWNWSCDRHCWYSNDLRDSTIMKNVQFIPYSYLKIFLQLLQNTHTKKN